MHAQKFQIRYSPVQDRVLIIVTGEDAQERMFGLTRRLVKRLVPGLRNIMGADVFATLSPNDLQPDPPEPKPGARPASDAAAAGPSGSAADGTATTPGEQPAQMPAPAPDPTHLVTRLRIVEKAEGTHMLQISDSATTLNVPLNRDQIIQFTRGIMTVLHRAEWGLDWNEEIAAPDAAPASPDAPACEIDISADSPSRYRH
jgi:hypothetical protein